MDNQTLTMKALLAFWTFTCAGIADDVLLQDFEADTYGDWTAAGDAFGNGPAAGTLGNQMVVTGFGGTKLANSFLRGDVTTGSLQSPKFQIQRPFLSFQIGGGNLPDLVGVQLIVEGRVVRAATGHDSEKLRWHSWNVADLRGAKAQIRVFDNATDGWGHILADSFIQTDRSRELPKVGRLEFYRKSPHYFRERYRPQYHFTPEVNWINDPNGLVYYDGEYHLFYQHNPHGNRWGHMSWGHAVSKDLLHWKHLPIALHDEHGVMVFSGCAVMDHANTSGFGSDGRPAMIAIYTGHGFGRQTQDLAYSLDKGRTWTKYAGNPVLDLREKDFRDPKVFWHEPTERWIMVVSLAVKKRIQFYGSSDLKDWKLLSEFGPAGVKDKPNWECPDLFELPVENTSGQRRWVLEVDIGGGAIAGGSGGEYFVGQFDGTRFIPDSAESQWVDYGRDFYAPVSWSDIPEEDQRRIWIGWMNNWQTAENPTYPWRGAMSLPRQLSLRKTPSAKHAYRLIQQPVDEVEKLRTAEFPIDTGPLNDEVQTAQLRGTLLEFSLQISPGSARRVGLRVLAGGEHHTEIAYEPMTHELSIDRRRSSGESFHPAFPGKHGVALDVEPGAPVELRIFVDACSVEVFADRGARVLTDLVFPAPGADGVVFFAEGGKAEGIQGRAFSLRSVWNNR